MFSNIIFSLFNRFYTIRYREKDKEKEWIFQLCPATETIVENLKPNTVYEFGVKDNIEGGIWSKIFNHKTIVGSKYLFGPIKYVLILFFFFWSGLNGFTSCVI